MRGMRVCYYHGGATRHAKNAAAARTAQAELDEQIRNTLISLDIEPVDNPLDELARLAGEARAFKNELARHVEALTELRYRGGGGEQIRAELTLYRDALRDLGSLLVQIARLNIDERLARVSERQAEIVADAIGAVLNELGLPREVQVEARRGLARHLHTVPG